MISFVDVGVLDRNSEHLGVDVRDLMEAAGRALAEEIRSRVDQGKKVVIVAGTGNNGGDGIVAARYLSSWKVPVAVLMIKDVSRTGSELSRKALADLPGDVPAMVLDKGGREARTGEVLEGAGVVVDGVLGSGVKGDLRDDLVEVVTAMNSFDGVKIAIDNPTGLGQGTGFKADVTVTFHDIKEEMMTNDKAHPDCGEVVIRKIGIPDEAATYVGPGDLLRVPMKPGSSRKGEGGRTLVIGGGLFTGAPSLAASAALKTGTDLVHAAVPRGIADVVASFSMDLIVERLPTLTPYKLGPEVLPELRAIMKRSSSILIGPGAGSDRGTLHLLEGALEHAISINLPVVVDADGITAVSELWGGGAMGHNVLLTPHRGELRRLVESFLPEADSNVLRDPYERSEKTGSWNVEALEIVSELERKLDATMLIKGPVDLCFSGDPPSLSDNVAVELSGRKVYRRYCTAGVPAMSVGGTGDILAGLCAGLISRGLRPFDAACVAAYVNGKAGEEAFSQLGHSLSASEVLSRVKLCPPR
ncbi:MAG: NAD(P)H-hydrate dehydratase [Candidatus Thermoplasmatota archaeon]|nr:NAD(P)H-hydrate dehydratase [Candidatus Thermoplasmatota archaeon]